MRVRRSAAVMVAIAVLLLPACTSSGESVDETEVQGVQIERDEPTEVVVDPTPLAEADVEATPRPRPTIVRVPVESSPEPASQPTAPPAASTTTQNQAQAPAPQPPPPAPAPSPESETGSTDTSSTIVERPSPSPTPSEALRSGAGWSFAALHPHDDGSGWTETSSTPPVDRSGDSGHRSFTTVTSTPVGGSQTLLDVGCPSWVAAGPEVGLTGRGTVTAELLSGTSVLASTVHVVDVALAAGQRGDELAWGALLRVDAADGATVTCRVRVDV